MAEAEVFGAVTFEYNPEGDKASTKVGKQLGVATVGSLGTVTLTRKVDDVIYKFKATETTFKNLRSLNGGVLTVQKPFGPLTAIGGLELGSQRSLNGTIKGKWLYEGKKSLEASAFWSERSGATILSLIAQPHKDLKLTNRLNSKSQVVTSLVDGQISGFTISPAINWKTAEKGLSVARKVKGGKLKASYGFDSNAYGIEYDYKPYKVAVTGKTSGKGAGQPKLSLAYNKDVELGQVKNTFNRRTGEGKVPGGKVPSVRRDIPLDAKLKELDVLYDGKLAKAKA